MARKRMIDPEFWSDEEIGKWSHSARLFYIGLWNFSDDAGRFKAHPNLLKSQIFPYDEKIDIENLKIELGDKIQWYEAGGSSYGFIRKFLKHQRIDKPQPSKLPAPPPFADDSPKIPGTLREQSGLIEEKRREENIKETLPRATAEAVDTVDILLKTSLNEVYKGGLNIYALIERLKKELRWSKGQQFPDEVLMRVCDQYWLSRETIQKPWPWFLKVIKEQWYKYNAENNIKEHEQIKKDPGALSFAQILEAIK